MINNLNVGFSENKQEKLVYLTSSLLQNNENIKHFFSSRRGGVSKNNYNSLNLGIYIEEDYDNVMRNFDLIGNATNMNLDKMVYLNQVHSNIFYVIDENNYKELTGKNGDALITCCKDIAIGVFTADCVPILINDTENGIIAAVHAGWKGTYSRIAYHVVRHMIDSMHSNPQNLCAAIGPSIGECCFEVNGDVADKFTYKRHYGEKWHVDLVKENMEQLISCGLLKENIDIGNLCTKCNDELFFSYRRDNSVTGRQGSFIQLI
jgi:polyphenol oxidase